MAEGDFGGVTGTRAETTEDEPAEGDSGGDTGTGAETTEVEGAGAATPPEAAEDLLLTAQALEALIALADD